MVLVVLFTHKVSLCLSFFRCLQVDHTGTQFRVDQQVPQKHQRPGSCQTGPLSPRLNTHSTQRAQENRFVILFLFAEFHFLSNFNYLE